MQRKTIAIDIDDVLADATEALRHGVNTRLSIDLQPEHYQVEGDYWGYFERVWASHGLSDKISYDFHHQEMMIDQSHVPLLPGASFAIAELSKSYDIAIITARDLSWQNATTEWLNKHFGKVFKGVHYAGNKYIEDTITKGQQAKIAGASWLIDDNPGHCLSAKEEGLEAILFGSYGWHHNYPKDLLRCKDWPEVMDYFNALN